MLSLRIAVYFNWVWYNCSSEEYLCGQLRFVRLKDIFEYYSSHTYTDSHQHFLVRMCENYLGSGVELCDT